MRLRAEPPRVTRLSRKVLAGLGLIASVGLGGALIYALQTRDGARPNEELYSTENRSTADGLAGLPRDYAGVPRLCRAVTKPTSGAPVIVLVRAA
jgi:type IV secretion system protein VirB10